MTTDPTHLETENRELRAENAALRSELRFCVEQLACSPIDQLLEEDEDAGVELLKDIARIRERYRIDISDIAEMALNAWGHPRALRGAK
jgi:hypothetical protein